MNDKLLQKKRAGKLAARLILYFLAFLTLIFTLLGLFIRTEANTLIHDVQKDNLIRLSGSIRDTLSLQMQAACQLVYAYSMNDVFVDGLNRGDFYGVDNTLRKLVSQNEYFETVFLTDREGLIFAATDFTSMRKDVSDREYFDQSVRQNRNLFVTSGVIESRSTGNPVAVFSSPIRYNGKVIGMLAASMDLGAFGKDLIVGKRIGRSGYPYVVDSRGKVIIHPDPELILFDAGEWDFMQAVHSMDGQDVYYPYTFQGTARQAAFSRLENPEWMVVTVIDNSEVFAISRRLTLILILSLIGTDLLLGIFLTIIVRRRITGRLLSLEQLMEQAAGGRLTERGRIAGSDELTSITVSYNALIDSLETFFGGLAGRLGNLDEGGSELSANMEETAAAVHQIKANIAGSAGQLRMQEESVSSTSAAVEEMTRNIESLDESIEKQNRSVLASSSSVEQMIARIKALGTSTEEAELCMNRLVGSSERGRENIGHVADLVETISDKSRDLEEANTLISGIAARTSLLAMNAAIEAAHAGDAGRGFAVVADEIRKLAEQSTAQSSHVKKSIADIHQHIHDVVDGSRVSGQSFEEIREGIDGMNRITGEIRSSMEEQVSGSTVVLSSLKEMRDITEGVKDGSREMTQGNRQILESVSRLDSLSRQVSLAMKEIEHGINEINQAVISVTDLTEKNRENIEGVREDASRYKL